MPRTVGDSIIREIEDEGRNISPDLPGVLLTSQGEEAEQLLAGYLEFIRAATDQSQPGMGGEQDVEAALSLLQKRSGLLRSSSG
jgi:hypothetical protein